MKKALVLSLVFALGLGFAVSAQTLSGSWDTDIIIDPNVVSIDIDSTLSVDYAIGAWTFGTVIGLDSGGLTGLDFSVGGVLGAFTIDSDLAFDVDLVAFKKWQTVVGVSIAGVTFGADFTLATGTLLVLSGSGVAGDVMVTVDLTLGSDTECDFDFNSVDITVDFPFYCAEIAAVLEFNCDGFEQICFSTDGIVVPSFPWLTIDADLCFQTGSKTLTISPDFDFGAGVCFVLYMDLGHSVVAANSPLTFESFTIYGIGIEANFGGVVFTGLTGFDEANNELVKEPSWQTVDNYWEVYTIATSDDGCCGGFTFDLSVYFLEGGVQLFDLGAIQAGMSYDFGALTFSTGLAIDINNEDFAEWIIGFEVVW